MESEIFIARINDTLTIAQKTSKPKFFGFLSLEEVSLAQKTLEKRNAKFCLFGGYEGAQRVMLCCMPDWCDGVEFPITAITFSYRTADELRHRDFLGAIMALGIVRESVGDILVENGRAVVFFKNDVLSFVKNNLSVIGRVGVAMSDGFSLPLPQGDSLVSGTVTVSSLRLDCVVAALTNLSRGTANQLIEAGVVSINSQVCEKITRQINTGDALTVRGKGKYIIGKTDGKTRKDRIILEFKKYF